MSSPYQPYPQDPQGGYGQPPYPPRGGWDPSQRGYLQGGPVGFGEAISEGFRNIVTFNGRASRSAFWWFFLGAIIIDLIAPSSGTRPMPSRSSTSSMWSSPSGLSAW